MGNKVIGYCTVFKRKNNKALFTFDILKGFIKEHALALTIIKGGIRKQNEDIYNNLLNFINLKGSLNTESKKLIDNFNKLYRILIQNNNN